jgi:hypothetical protein
MISLLVVWEFFMLSAKKQILLGAPLFIGSIFCVLYVFLNNPSQGTAKFDTSVFADLLAETRKFTREFAEVSGSLVAQNTACLNESKNNQAFNKSPEIQELVLRQQLIIHKLSDNAREVILEEFRKYTGLGLDEDVLTQESITHIEALIAKSSNVPKLCSLGETEKLQAKIRELVFQMQSYGEKLKLAKLKMLLDAGKSK